MRSIPAAALKDEGHGASATDSSGPPLRADPPADGRRRSPRSIASAKAVRESAIPEIAHALRQGQMAVSQAVLVARLSEPRQQQVAAEMHDGRSLSKVVLAASRQERVEAIERASTARPLSALGRRFPVLYADPPGSSGCGPKEAC